MNCNLIRSESSRGLHEAQPALALMTNCPGAANCVSSDVHCLQLEMILQAQEYEQEQEVDLQDFFDSTEGRFATPLGQAWAKEIIKRRPGKAEKAAGKA